MPFVHHKGVVDSWPMCGQLEDSYSMRDRRVPDLGKIRKGVNLYVQSVDRLIGVKVEIPKPVAMFLQLGWGDVTIDIKEIIKNLQDGASDLVCDRIANGCEIFCISSLNNLLDENALDVVDFLEQTKILF
eukprot:12234407-Ditylum_brightwellii.AAC.1